MGLVKAAPSKLVFSLDQMAKIVLDSRKDPLMIDFARQVGTRYADMVEWASHREGNFQSGHNNKTLFSEAIDIWFRYYFSEGSDFRGPTTRDVREVIAHVMDPWYEAMKQDDPSTYRARLTPPPVFVGDYADVVAFELGACACLEIQPLSFRFGMEQGEPIHVWALIQAEGKAYDSDVSQPGFKLGDRLEFESIEDVEVPL